MIIKRVPYGRSDIPPEEREYFFILGKTKIVGTLLEIKEYFAKHIGFIPKFDIIDDDVEPPEIITPREIIDDDVEPPEIITPRENQEDIEYEEKCNEWYIDILDTIDMTITELKEHGKGEKYYEEKINNFKILRNFIKDNYEGSTQFCWESLVYANPDNPEVAEGDRIELVYTTDPYTSLKSGDRGTVSFIDSMGTIHVDWDNGASLGLLPHDDEYIKIY